MIRAARFGPSRLRRRLRGFRLIPERRSARKLTIALLLMGQGAIANLLIDHDLGALLFWRGRVE